MDAGVELRAAEAGDAEALARLFGELGYPADPEAVARRLGDAAAVVVAVDRGTPVGMASLALVASPVQGSWARLTALVVAEDARSRGIGMRLVAEVERIAAEAGCFAVEVTSSPHREAAHRFYRRLGYEHRPARFLKALPPSADARASMGGEATKGGADGMPVL